MTLEKLNALDRESFVAAVGWVFEHSPWVAERAWSDRPFRDSAALLEAMYRRVEEAAPEEQLALLRAHPDLGAGAKLSRASAVEQSGAGLDQLTRQDFGALIMLYKQKFGFPFIYAVKGSDVNDILAALLVRLEEEPENEYAEALRQVRLIARFRLNEYFGQEH